MVDNNEFFLNNEFSLALEQGQCDVVDAMLDRGYIPEKKSIVIPCENGNVDMLTRLLKYPMDLQQGLFVAIENEHTHLLDHLYLAGADIHLPNEKGNTTLHVVQDIDTCKWLLDMGVRQMPNAKGCTPLLEAFLDYKSELVKVLLSYPGGPESINRPSKYDHTPLFEACLDGFLENVDLLLSYPQGVDAISHCNHRDTTPLLAACEYNYIEVVRRLLSYPQGVKTIEKQDDLGFTPLLVACHNGNTEIVELLLSYPEGIKTVNIANVHNVTPFSCASHREYSQVIKLLSPHIV